MRLPPQLIDQDLGRWYGISYEGGGFIPWLVVHLYLENIERLTQWARINGKSVLYERDLTKGLGYHRTFVAAYGDRYLRLNVRLDGSQNLPHVMADLDALFQLLRSARELEFDAFNHDPDRLQLMQLSIGSRPNEMGEVHLGGVLSPAIMEWAEKQGTADFPEIADAMMRVWNNYARFRLPRSEGPRPWPGVRVETRGNQGILVETLGDACGVSTDDAYRRTIRKGCNLGCHNMDGHLRQLTVLVALGCFHKLAAHDLDKGPPDD